jgi:putative NIF3 family GTP cyclohydrolase 1 type 2
MKTAELVSFLADFVGPFNTEEGIRFGNSKSDIKGICVCWMATKEAISFAKENNTNVILCHEDLFLPYGKIEKGDLAADFLSWDVNYGRVKLLSKYDISVVRLHLSLDKKYILDAFARQLGLGKPVNSISDCEKIYEITPVAFCDLAIRVKKAMQMDKLRAIVRKPDRKVTRVALLWGGMGLFVNAEFVNGLLNQNVDVLVAGETDNYIMRMVAESGVDIIETSHELSENEGLKNFSNELAATLKTENVVFYQMPCCWKIL